MVMFKLLFAPLAIPIALSVAITLAGPGGPFEVKDNHEPAAHPTADFVLGSTDLSEATAETIATSNGALGAATPDTPTTPVGDSETPNVAETADDAANSPGCVDALTDHAQARPKLEEHANDPTKPEGGASGNQNALDHQCGGAFATETVPENSEPTPAPDEPSSVQPDTGNGNANANGHDNKPDEKNGNANGH